MSEGKDINLVVYSSTRKMRTQLQSQSSYTSYGGRGVDMCNGRIIFAISKELWFNEIYDLIYVPNTLIAPILTYLCRKTSF